MPYTICVGHSFFLRKSIPFRATKPAGPCENTFCKEILLLTKTTYYQLNQWDATDRVLRTDFNGDNAKIDAALHDLAGRGAVTQLKTFTTTAAVTGTANFSMDVRDIDWGAWQSVYVDMTLKGSGYMLLYPNGNKDAAYSSGYVTSNSYDSLAGMIGCGADGPGTMRAEFQIFCQGGKTLQVVCPFEKIVGRSTTVTYDGLQTLHLTPYHESYTMAAGSVVSFWGVK